MTPPPPEKLTQALTLFQNGEFFECHEVLEDLWQPLPPGDEKTFYQGIIQVAVGRYHLKNGNMVGARNKLKAGLEKLRPLAKTDPFKRWLDLSHFIKVNADNLPSNKS